MRKLSHWLARWRESADPHVGLDSLLAGARAEAPAEARLEWLHDLVAWLRRDARRGEGEAGASAPTVRLKHLLAVLERNPGRKLAVAAMLRAALAERDAVDLLTETGMPREAGLIGEFASRALARVLPEPPPADLAELFVRVFPDRSAATRIEEIAPDTWEAALALVDYGAGDGGAHYRRRLAESAEEALRVLAAQVSATTHNSAIRRRMESAPGAALPTAGLPFALERFFAARLGGDRGAVVAAAEGLREAFGSSLIAVEQAYAHLDSQGVSIAIVYQLERVRAQLQRMGELAELLGEPAKARAALRYFLASLVRDVHDHRSLAALLRQNFALAARKVVERSAETGEHYITRTRAEYADMLRRAGGGGAFTAVTVYLKFAIGAFQLPLFLEGFLASVNYAASFVAIQLLGFTLATKQPAMTGPALAARMKGLEDRAKLEAFVDEVANLVRSQSAGIFGNVFLVFPVAWLLGWALLAAFGAGAIPPEKAGKTVDSLSILGPSVFFAAFTGVLLWLSSVIAGWADNWFVYRRLGPAIASHRRLAYVFGPSGAKRIAAFFEHEIAGLAGNVSLGFLLGSVPVFLAFYGLPVEVRHVTLSTGQLAASVAALGWGVALTAPFWLAVAGIALIGALNVGVSFALALAIAIRGRGIEPGERRAVYGAILRRLASEPGSFLFPRQATPQTS